MIYPCKFGKNPTTGSQDIVQTRNGDANRIQTKNSMSPSPEVCECVGVCVCVCGGGGVP